MAHARARVKGFLKPVRLLRKIALDGEPSCGHIDRVGNLCRCHTTTTLYRDFYDV